MPKGNYEKVDIRTGKARKHQIAAEKGKNSKSVFKVEYFSKFGAKWTTQKNVEPQTTLKGAMAKAMNIIKKVERANVKAGCDLRPESYGECEVPMLRIVNYVNGKHKKSYLVTDEQKKEIKSNTNLKDIYNADKDVDLQYLVIAYMQS